MIKQYLSVVIVTFCLNVAPANAQFTCDITVAPSYTSRGITKTRAITFVVFDAFGDLVPFCPMKVELLPVANSYGHQHTNGTRPVGVFSPASGNTGADGLGFKTTYTAPEVSGQVIIRISGDPPGAICQDGTPTPPAEDIGMCVETSGLIALPVGSSYALTGQTATHPVNHYGTPAMISAIQSLADSFFVAAGSVALGINDVSLVKGGLFDYLATWAPPHSSHRVGLDVDINLPQAIHRRLLLSLLAKFQLRRIVEPGTLTHYHLRMN